MATDSMTRRQGRFLSYEYHAEIADGVTGPSVILPPMGSNGARTNCTINLSSSTGKFQYTSSSEEDVLDDTANWYDWDKGEVTESTSDALTVPVMALRGVSISGTITIDIMI